MKNTTGMPSGVRGNRDLEKGLLYMPQKLDLNNDGVVETPEVAAGVITTADVDDSPADGATTDPISSNWAFDHAADTTSVHNFDASGKAPPQTHASGHAVGGADSVFPADPNADKALVWDDSESAIVWWGIGMLSSYLAQLSAAVEANDYAKFDASGIIGRTYSEVLSDIGAESETHAADHAVGAADTLFPADPGADKVLGWDDSETALAWVAAGAGSGDVATDAIWDAKGDLAVGTGLDTAAKLTVGADGKYLKAASGEATGLIWDTPAGSGDFLANGTVPLTGDIDFAGTQQCHDLAAPAASGEAIRQTAVITEASVDDAVDKAHAINTDTAFVTKALYDADSVVTATSDDTPIATTMAEQTVLGRLTGGHPDDIAIGIADNNILQVDQADLADNDFLKATAVGVEGRSYAETATDLKDQFPQAITDNHVVTVDSADATTGEYAKFTANGLESKSIAEVITDIGITTTIKTAQETVNNSSVLQKDDHLCDFAAVAGKYYDMHCQIVFNSGTTPDLKIQFQCTGDTEIKWNIWNEQANPINFNLGGTVKVINGAGDWRIIYIDGQIKGGAGGGTVSLWWAQNTANASDTKFDDGWTFWRIIRLN